MTLEDPLNRIMLYFFIYGHIIAFIVETFYIWLHYCRHIKNYSLGNLLDPEYRQYTEIPYNSAVEMLTCIRYLPLLAQFMIIIVTVLLIVDLFHAIGYIFKQIFSSKCLIQRIQQQQKKEIIIDCALDSQNEEIKGDELYIDYIDKININDKFDKQYFNN